MGNKNKPTGLRGGRLVGFVDVTLAEDIKTDENSKLFVAHQMNLFIQITFFAIFSP